MHLETVSTWMKLLGNTPSWLLRLAALQIGMLGAHQLEIDLGFAQETLLPTHVEMPESGAPPAPVRTSADAVQVAAESDKAEMRGVAIDQVAGTQQPLAPYSTPSHLKFRKAPLRNLDKLLKRDPQSSEFESAVANAELNAETDDEKAVRSAGLDDEETWQVELQNPLRKGASGAKETATPKVAKPFLEPKSSAEVKPPADAKTPSDAKPIPKSDSELDKEPKETLGPKLTDPNKPWSDIELVLPSEKKGAEESEDQETVLHLDDVKKKAAPLPPGTKESAKPLSSSKKKFDPEDNDQPLTLGPIEQPDVVPGDMPESEADSAEPHASELLELIQRGSPNASLKNAPSESAKPLDSGSSKELDMDLEAAEIASEDKPKVPPADRTNTSGANTSSPAKQPLKLTPQTVRLRSRIDAALNYYLLRPESNVERSPWAVFHSILPYGSETTLRADGRIVSAISWMCYNGSCRGQRIFIPLRDGSFRPAVGAGVQGHEGQFLAILAQSRVPANYPLQVGRKRYTLEYLIDYEMRTCQPKTELTFKLLSLSHYLVNDATWVNEQGEEWSLERLVEEELAQPVIGAACGGTHRLMGLSYALKQRQAAGLPLTGQYSRAEIFLKDFVGYTWTLQNPDGSFSTEWFEGRANQQDMQRKLQTTGHIVEWLVYTLPDEELQSPRLLRSIEFLTYCLVEQRQTDWKIGPRSHALHALAMYQERVFGVTMGSRRNMATTNRSQRR
jgi:hypothetical protein